MEFALTSPVWALEWSSRSDFLFVLAQYLKYESYRKFVKGWRYRSESITLREDERPVHNIKPVMMDNGAYENALQTPEQMLEQAEMVKPDIIVSPDRYRVKDTTVELTTAFLDEYVGNAEIMVVPQGRDDFEWMRCFWEMNSELAYDWVGIPRWLEETPMGRVGCYNKVKDVLRKRGKKVHLLGLPNPMELKRYKGEGDVIKSVDTSWPFTYAKQGRIGSFGAEERVDMLCIEALPGFMIQAGIDLIYLIIQETFGND